MSAALLRALGFASLAYAQSGLELIPPASSPGWVVACSILCAALVDRVHLATWERAGISCWMMLESAGVVGALLGSWLLN